MTSRWARAARQGITLVEIMVAVAIMVGVLAASIPVVSGLMALEQRGVVHNLATTFGYLRDEAVLRSVTFRIAFDLDRGSYRVQVGSPDAVIFQDAEERETWERELESALSRFTKREIQGGAADELLDATGRFANLQDVSLDTDVSLPTGTRFAWAWTPQHRDLVRGSGELLGEEEEGTVVYSHIFPDGQMESTVLRIVSARNLDDGYTLVVEPLTGRIHVLTEEVDPRDLNDWLPVQGPELPR